MVMRFVYSILMAVFLVVFPLLAAVVCAQDHWSADEHQPPSVDEIVARMKTKLSLTPDQVAAVTPIIEKYLSKGDELRQGMQDGTADRDSLRVQLKHLRLDEGQELSQVLSADQMNRWKSMSKGWLKYSSKDTVARGN